MNLFFCSSSPIGNSRIYYESDAWHSKKLGIHTFSPIASWIRTVSPAILPTTSPVLASLSKKVTSCRKMAFRYLLLIRAACRSPVMTQHVTSAHQDHNLHMQSSVWISALAHWLHNTKTSNLWSSSSLSPIFDYQQKNCKSLIIIITHLLLPTKQLPKYSNYHQYK